MEKQFRLRKNYQFNYVYRNGKSCGDNNLIIIYCKNKNGKPKVGFSISKKFGKAVKRNLMRRRLKEIFNKQYKNLDTRYNYVILPRIKEQQATFKELQNSVDFLVEKIKNS